MQIERFAWQISLIVLLGALAGCGDSRPPVDALGELTIDVVATNSNEIWDCSVVGGTGEAFVLNANGTGFIGWPNVPSIPQKSITWTLDTPRKITIHSGDRGDVALFNAGYCVFDSPSSPPRNKQLFFDTDLNWWSEITDSEFVTDGSCRLKNSETRSLIEAPETLTPKCP